MVFKRDHPRYRLLRSGVCLRLAAVSPSFQLGWRRRLAGWKLQAGGVRHSVGLNVFMDRSLWY